MVPKAVTSKAKVRAKVGAKMDDLTVKQLAEELNVSKPYVMKRIERLGHRERLIKSGNRYLIPVFVADAVRESFSAPEPVPDTAPTNAADMIALLQAQLDIKDKQIERLQTENAELVKAIQQTNYLLAAAQTPDEPEPAAEPIEKSSGEPVPEPQPQRRSFFERLFKRQ